MEKLKELRDKTGAGIGDCKKALDETGGDIDKAVEILRKKGIAKAAKRGDREAGEGIIMVAVNPAASEGYIAEVNAETDFVVRSDKFQEFADKIFTIIREKKPVSREEFMALKMDDGHSIEDNLNTLSGVIGEKLGIKRLDVASSAGTVAAYSHMGGRIGVLVALDKPQAKELAINIAMQIAAANPKYISPANVPAEEIAKEKEIYREQLKKEGKPEAMIEKILEGKINKYFEEVCLVKQEYVKDDKKKVEDILEGVKVEKFVRYSL